MYVCRRVVHAFLHHCFSCVFSSDLPRTSLLDGAEETPSVADTQELLAQIVTIFRQAFNRIHDDVVIVFMALHPAQSKWFCARRRNS